MNSYKLLSCLLLFIVVPVGLQAQENSHPTYYRYFNLEIENLKEIEFNKFTTARTSLAYLKFSKFCSSKSQVLVLFDASQSKRLQEMKEEIREAVANHLPSKRVLSIKANSYSEQSNFCK